MKVAAFLTLLVAASTVDGQVAAVRPPNPTSLDAIVVDVLTPDQDLQLQSVEVVGNEVRITISGYPTTPALGLVAVPIGRLAAGSYVILVTFIYEDTFGNPAFVSNLAPVPLQVTEGFIVPTLGEAGLIALVLAMAAVGATLSKR